MVKGVLLTIGSYYGTLAAARLYHKQGIPVVLADSTGLNFTRFSRAVKRFVPCPVPEDLANFSRWLLEFGASHPGLFLYPTSDDMCWIIAKYRNKLQKYYRFAHPEIAVIRSLLDKAKLYQLAATVGIDVPPSFEPQEILTPDDPRLKYPVILKPRTQVGMRSKVKGIVVKSAKELPGRIAEFRRLVIYDAAVVADLPDVAEPLIQKFFQSAKKNTYSMSGYISADGKHFMLRASRKVLQNPPQVGVGICFQGTDVHQPMAIKLKKLCQSIGYYGVFEAEFIREQRGDEEILMLMDFNPRFYGQMEFEISRGLPLPLCLIHELQGNEEELNDIANQQKDEATQNFRFRHHVLLIFLLCTQLIGGKMPLKTWRYWLNWARETAFDPIYDRHDPVPLFIDLLQLIRHFLRHPRSAFKHYFR